MQIVQDPLVSVPVFGLLREHLRGMAAHSPPESIHALDLEGLRSADVTFWTAWNGHALLGCGALKAIDARHGEIKSMRTAAAHLRKGVGRAILARIVDEASRRRYTRLSLETGSGAAFEPAHRLYQSFGFRECGPFADYREDPFSRFMTLRV